MALPNKTELEKLMDANEVAQVLNVKVKTIYIWVCRRKVPFLKINGALRFRPSEIETFVGVGVGGTHATKSPKQKKTRGKDISRTVDRLVKQAREETRSSLG